MSKYNQPNEFDAVLGNQGIAAQGSMALGGLAGIKQQLNSHSLQAKVAALEDTVNYGTAGLQILIEYLNDPDLQIQNRAYELLASRSKSLILEHLDKAEHIDIMMRSLEWCSFRSPDKLIDNVLRLVKTSTEKERIEYYLFNGTQIQRNCATLYFKRLGEIGILTEAVEMGCIDGIQAFSK